MSKKRNSSDEIDCPLCGGKIWKAQKVIIEGAKMTVCQNCAQHGKKVVQKKKISYNKEYLSNKDKTTIKKPTFQSKESSIEIVPDYAKRIRISRTNRNLTQEQFSQKLNEKPSLMRRIESGKVEPTVKLAKKIEKVYGIILTRNVDDVIVYNKNFMKRKEGSTLGDIAFIKKKRNS